MNNNRLALTNEGQQVFQFGTVDVFARSFVGKDPG